MQLITNWSELSSLPIPHQVKQALLKSLIEPFNDETKAEYFWQTYGNSLVLFSSDDTAESFVLSYDNSSDVRHEKLPEELRNKINFSLTYPEFTEQLAQGYKLSLTIMNDEGSGCYLLYAPECPLVELIGTGFE